MTSRPGPRRRLHGDDGAVIVELALVAPFLVLLVLGVFEFGNVYRDKTLLAGALRSAGRTASQSGKINKADQVALTSFYATASKLKNVVLQKVIIYKTTASGGPPPASCLSASTLGTAPYGVAGLCNVYSGAQVSSAAAGLAAFNYGSGVNGTCTAANWDFNWCWNTRVLTPATADYLGVYAEYTYTGITTIMPVRTITLSDYAVYRMEPDV